MASAERGPFNIWPFPNERKPKASELYYQVMGNGYKNKKDEYGSTDVCQYVLFIDKL